MNPHPRGRGKTASRGLPNTPWSCVRKKYEASSSLERPEESGESGTKSKVAGQHTCVLHQLDPAVRVTTYLPAGFGALGGCQWREVSSPALWSRQSFGGAGGAAGVSRCGASHCETIPLGSVVGQDGADSLVAYRQEDPTTKEVDDLNRN